MADVQHSKPVRLAFAALQAALEDNTSKAGRYIQRISDECGGGGLEVALRAWIDTYASHATDGQPTATQVRIAFVEESTGALDQADSDRLPAELRWAGQLIAARVALDEDRYRYLLDQLPQDGKAVGDHIWAALSSVARTINGLPRGFARMGER